MNETSFKYFSLVSAYEYPIKTLSKHLHKDNVPKRGVYTFKCSHKVLHTNTHTRCS